MKGVIVLKIPSMCDLLSYVWSQIPVVLLPLSKHTRGTAGNIRGHSDAVTLICVCGNNLLQPNNHKYEKFFKVRRILFKCQSKYNLWIVSEHQ